MSIELLELAADALGPLLDEVVFVGGATITLWITDPGAPRVRPTKDVDAVVEGRNAGRLPRFRGAAAPAPLCRGPRGRRDLPLGATPAA
jgi:hypothetical protein